MEEKQLSGKLPGWEAVKVTMASHWCLMSQAISFSLGLSLEDAETPADAEQLNAAVDVHQFDCFSFFSKCVGFKHTHSV